MIKPEKTIIKHLSQMKQTLAVAESCTGGLIGHLLTNVPGSSTCFILDVIAYSNQAKCNILGISKSILEDKGAVSSEVACAMAKGIQKKANSDYSIGITGIAGPSGGSDAKPVGLVYIAVTTPEHIYSQKYIFTGTRLQIKKQSANKALLLLLSHIKKPR